MHIVIMGCGRVGSTLAHSLEARGHSVAVIDQNAGRVPPARRRLRRADRHRHRLRPRGADRGRHRAGRRLRRRLQRRQLEHHLGPAGPGDVRRATGSWPASTTRSAPRSTSGSASRPWPPSAGPPTGCCATWSRRAASSCGATRPARSSIVEVPLHPGWIVQAGAGARGGDAAPGSRSSCASASARCPRRRPCCRTATRSSCWSPTTWSATVTEITGAAPASA